MSEKETDLMFCEGINKVDVCIARNRTLSRQCVNISFSFLLFKNKNIVFYDVNATEDYFTSSNIYRKVLVYFLLKFQLLDTLCGSHVIL